MDGSADAVTYRPQTSEDLAFLLDSWGSSAFKGSHAHKALSPDQFHAFHRPIRERFFSKPNTCVIVACDAKDPWLIMGWIAVEQIPSGLILQYIYVKSSFKGQGIAKELIKRSIPTAPVFYTHLTERASKIISKKQDQFRSWIYIPHLV